MPLTIVFYTHVAFVLSIFSPKFNKYSNKKVQNIDFLSNCAGERVGNLIRKLMLAGEKIRH